MTKYAKNWGEHDLWAPPGYTYGDYIEISDYIKIRSPIYKSFVTYKEKFCLPCRTTRSFWAATFKPNETVTHERTVFRATPKWKWKVATLVKWIVWKPAQQPVLQEHIDRNVDFQNILASTPVCISSTSTSTSACVSNTSTNTPACVSNTSTSTPACVPNTSTNTTACVPSTSTSTPAYVPSTSTSTPAYVPSTSTSTPAYVPSTSTSIPVCVPSTSTSTPAYVPTGRRHFACFLQRNARYYWHSIKNNLQD